MAITTCGNCIEFGTCTMCATPTGFSFNGEFCAKEGFCDTRAFQGTVAGFVAGGDGFYGGINCFPFASDSNAVDAGELSPNQYDGRCAAGASSETSGYIAGGYNQPASPKYSNGIDKFPFSLGICATDIGDLACRSSEISGNTSRIDGNGYAVGGVIFPPLVTRNDIQKFPFSSDTNASDIGQLSQGYRGHNGHNSLTNGYASGSSANDVTRIDKFPFASETGVDAGSLLAATRLVSTSSSSEHGYTAGAFGPPATDQIQRFAFGSESTSSDIGELTAAKHQNAGSSSTTNGYSSGGIGPGRINVIEKYPYASSSSGSDVGDLTGTVCAATGLQV